MGEPAAKQKRVFITWDDHGSRAASLAFYLEAENHYVQSIRIRSMALVPLKYALNIFRTWSILLRERPEVVFIVAPPVFAVFPVWVYCRLSSCEYIIDTHCGALLDRRWAGFLRLHKFLAKGALVSILHNRALAERVATWGAVGVDMGDILYRLPTSGTYALRKGLNIVFVSTYSRDEPLNEVLEAARNVPEANFYITGRLDRAPEATVRKAPGNVVFTDYLGDEDYFALLKGSDIVVSLTINDLTMQNGIYEAIALGRPSITSDWPVLRTSAPRGTIWIDNRSESLVCAIRAIERHYSRYLSEAEALRNEYRVNWEKKLAGLLKILDDGPSRAVGS